MEMASINRISPPACVHARPVTTPGADILALVSDVNLTGPRYLGIFTTFMAIDSVSPLAIFAATPRHTAAISRSKVQSQHKGLILQVFQIQNIIPVVLFKGFVDFISRLKSCQNRLHRPLIRQIPFFQLIIGLGR